MIHPSGPGQDEDKKNLILMKRSPGMKILSERFTVGSNGIELGRLSRLTHLSYSGLPSMYIMLYSTVLFYALPSTIIPYIFDFSY